MDEQNGGGQPDFWEAWTASAGQSGPADPVMPPGDAEGEPADPGYSADPGAAPQQPPTPPGYSASTTQPIGVPPGYGQQAGYGGGGGYGTPPGYGGGYGGGGYGMPPGYGRPPRRRRGLATVITYLAVAALAATAGGLVVSFADSGSSQPSASQGNGGFSVPNNNGGAVGNGSGSTGASISNATEQKVKDAVLPGVVVINSSLQYEGNAVGAAGTGMIISRSGLVLTNNHVIDDTTGLTATVVATGRKYPAKWLGYDKTSDVAVIQIEGASGLSTVPIGDSSTVKLGDGVVAMGNAGGTGSISTVTGTITGLDQSITASDEGSGAPPERLTDMLQTNADIISGDSGGPLSTTTGEVIGMDTAASSGSYANQNVGFAIPINRAITIARQIIAGQSSANVQIGATGFVGVLVAGNSGGGQSTDTDPQAQLQQQEQAEGGQLGNGNQFGCVPSGENPGVPASIAPVSSGTLVLGAICGAPAAQAGLGPGDVITSIDSKKVSSPASLTGILQGIRGGATVPITWVTPSDQTMTRSLTVSTAPPQ